MTTAQNLVELQISGIKKVKGVLLIAFFSDEKSFLKSPVMSKKVPITATEMFVTIESPSEGPFALSIIVDENENGKLDTNMIGIPTEGFGFGNNASARFGPPHFKDTLIKFAPMAVRHQIKIKYF